ncbi:MAG: hypothetical protein N2116_02040 [Armatimonadetes bacterium]|nr:hypothetical protein [Armatimonadota bacterium]
MLALKGKAQSRFLPLVKNSGFAEGQELNATIDGAASLAQFVLSLPASGGTSSFVGRLDAVRVALIFR